MKERQLNIINKACVWGYDCRSSRRPFLGEYNYEESLTLVGREFQNTRGQCSQVSIFFLAFESVMGSSIHKE